MVKYSYEKSNSISLLEDLKSYFKEESVKINPRLKRSYIENTKYIIEEEKLPNDNKYILGRVKAKLSILNAPTQNGTFYSTEWANKAIIGNQQFQDKLPKKLILGETDHPNNPDGSIKNISHTVLKVWLENENELWGLVEIFNTPNGLLLWTLLKAGVVLGVSSRGIGDEYFEDGVKKIKSEDFEMIGWDFVINASAIGAEFVEFSESKQGAIMKDIEKVNMITKDNVSGSILESFTHEKKIQEVNTKLTAEVEELKVKVIEEAKKYTTYLEVNTKLMTENVKLKSDIDVIKKELNDKKIIIESKDKTIKQIEAEKVTINEKIAILEAENKNKEALVSKLKIENEILTNTRQSKKVEIVLNKKEENKEEKEENNIYKRGKYTYK